jgi:HAD superfamily hydrolase (TIGR01484 family)
MKPLSTLDHSILRAIDMVFTDVDDTLTTHGRLHARCLGAMEALRDVGIRVVPVTGRPAGWCQGLPRLWPIAGIVAENGAAAYWIENGRQQSLYWEADAQQRAAQRAQLQQIQGEICEHFPGLMPAQDQFLRVGDIAFDIAENVSPIPAAQIQALVAKLQSYGLTTAVSSIHAHGYFGSRNKRTMTQAFAAAAWKTTLDTCNARALFIGDSANDAPMFDYFSISIGVANVVNAITHLPTPPAYITQAECGEGFIEMAQHLLLARQ